MSLSENSSGFLVTLQRKEDAAAAARKAASALGYEWLTTAPNPRVRGSGTDDGQRGWRCHAVKATNSTILKDLGRSAAACGLRPGHGWGVDLFIERTCIRCEAALARIAENAPSKIGSPEHVAQPVDARENPLSRKN